MGTKVVRLEETPRPSAETLSALVGYIGINHGLAPTDFSEILEFVVDALDSPDDKVAYAIVTSMLTELIWHQRIHNVGPNRMN